MPRQAAARTGAGHNGYQTVVFSVYTTSPVVDISVSLRVRGQYTTSASVWPLVMVSRSGSNFTN
ncbi:host specificity protein [Salmonella enterica subsp. enterica]|nr:host specificity protein [Salmonella enterica subsp. enterica serovar Enteritidis]EAQ5245599.1 host specificity protein [Salmonella enterica]EAS5448359.1 host specificity protein [Salmonella enterica]ECG4009020.1 host specificity protein [Salmonella enterica subsp. enterica serovar Enteritidis]ECS7832445.1 host specificity protein [Salmonella enterica subsp. enterica serovar Enteritidis]